MEKGENHLKILLFISGLLCLSTAFAADKNGSFAVRSAGMMTCETFVQEKSERSKSLNLYMGWIDGYISAANQYTNDTFDLVPWGNTVLLATLLENHCKANPEQRFYIAVNQLVGTLMQERITEKTDFVETKHGENSTYLYQTILVQVQEKLIDKGLFKGNANGEFGDDTRLALEAYQKDNKLKVTGLPDQLTLYKIFGGIGKRP